MRVGRTIGSLAVSLLCIAALATAAAAAPTATHANRVSQLETDVLAQLNTVRRAHGLLALKLSSTLSNAAEAHSVQMGEDGYFAHDSADGSDFWKRVEQYYPSRGWSYWAVGENLLWSSPDVSASGALKLWMASPGHRKNILTAKWREIGISAVKVPAAPGSYKGLDVTIVTTDFGVRR